MGSRPGGDEPSREEDEARERLRAAQTEAKETLEEAEQLEEDAPEPEADLAEDVERQ
jgi:hypothetical protein